MATPTIEMTAARPARFGAARAEFLALGSVVFASAGQLLLKAGLSGRGAVALWLPALGLCVYGLGTFLWIAAVSRAEISYLYPLSALSYTLVALGGKGLLGEHVGWERWSGIAVMSLGVALLLGSGKGERA